MKPSSNGIALSDNEVLPRPSKEQKSHTPEPPFDLWTASVLWSHERMRMA